MSRITMAVLAITALCTAAILAAGLKDVAVAGFAVPALLIIISLGVFVLLMIYATTSLTASGIVDATQPFGLPPGTVRAILTLSFVVLVGVFGSYILAKSNDRTLLVPIEGLSGKEMSQVAADALAAKLGNEFVVVSEGSADKVKVTVMGRPDHSAADDIAKQIVTILATLLSAMIGFYFGSRAEGGESRTDPVTELARARLAQQIAAQDEKSGAAASEIIAAKSKFAAPLTPAKQSEFDKLATSLTKSAEDLKVASAEARKLASDSKASPKALEEAASKVASLGDAFDKARSAVANFTP